jgi:hypothetical protein
MKISKEKAVKFAVKEFEVRNGEDWINEISEDPNWTVKDEVLQEGNYKDWQRSPEGCLATMMYDYAFGQLNAKDIAKLKRFYGDKLWDAAILCLLNRDHDT